MAQDLCQETKGGRSLNISKDVDLAAVKKSIKDSMKDNVSLINLFTKFETLAEELASIEGSSFTKYAQ